MKKNSAFVLVGSLLALPSYALEMNQDDYVTSLQKSATNVFNDDNLYKERSELLGQLEEATNTNSVIFNQTGDWTVRKKEQRKYAITLGAQGGFYWRSTIVNSYLLNVSQQLDEIYNFAPLMQKHMVMPPIIHLITEKVSLSEDQQAMETVRLQYKIDKPARFMSVTPTWRDYLNLSAEKPEKDTVPIALLPKNDEERVLWKQWVGKGWLVGEKQADKVFLIKVAKIESDYLGALRFIRLEQSGKISMPRVGVGRFGIRVDGKRLNADTKLFKITASARFMDTDQWKAPMGVDYREQLNLDYSYTDTAYE